MHSLTIGIKRISLSFVGGLLLVVIHPSTAFPKLGIGDFKKVKRILNGYIYVLPSTFLITVLCYVQNSFCHSVSLHLLIKAEEKLN